MADLRPIALCNVKVLANRLKCILPKIILEPQSAFIPSRLITENFMTAFEICHFIKRKGQCTNEVIAMKTDMSKAYDRLEWQFLKEIMQKLGFHDKWVDLIMQCVCSVQYKILHKGTGIGPITPERGLRPGDPLSPYLFIICANSLSSALKETKDLSIDAALQDLHPLFLIFSLLTTVIFSSRHALGNVVVLKNV